MEGAEGNVIGESTLMDDEELKEYRERIFTNLKEVVRDCDEISPEELVKRLEA